MQAVKNPVELAGMSLSHRKDGAAMAEFFAALERDVAAGTAITEVDIDLRVTACRAAMGQFFEPSFDTIAGVNSNGAIIHYR